MIYKDGVYLNDDGRTMTAEELIDQLSTICSFVNEEGDTCLIRSREIVGEKTTGGPSIHMIYKNTRTGELCDSYIPVYPYLHDLAYNKGD